MAFLTSSMFCRKLLQIKLLPNFMCLNYLGVGVSRFIYIGREHFLYILFKHAVPCRIYCRPSFIYYCSNVPFLFLCCVVPLALKFILLMLWGSICHLIRLKKLFQPSLFRCFIIKLYHINQQYQIWNSTCLHDQRILAINKQSELEDKQNEKSKNKIWNPQSLIL